MRVRLLRRLRGLWRCGDSCTDDSAAGGGSVWASGGGRTAGLGSMTRRMRAGLVDGDEDAHRLSYLADEWMMVLMQARTWPNSKCCHRNEWQSSSQGCLRLVGGSAGHAPRVWSSTTGFDQLRGRGNCRPRTGHCRRPINRYDYLINYLSKLKHEPGAYRLHG